MTILAYASAIIAAALSGYRWLRVAQREHYERGRVSRLARLWARRPTANLALWVAAAALIVPVPWALGLAVLPAALISAWPAGMPIRPRSGPLVFTWRLRRLAAAYALAAAVIAVTLGPVGLLLLGLSSPLVLDALLALLRPAEARLASRFVRAATGKLRSIDPTIVAITGSYGKTSTKLYTAALLATRYSVFASPRSYNNLLGLARAVNEGMPLGTEVFVAEMGTYGPGEIRRLCEVFTPTISAITTIGEAHLERMGSREAIVRAKSEILDDASVVVLNVDTPELAALAEKHSAKKKVIRCSTDPASAADVIVAPTSERATVTIGGESAGNLAVTGTMHVGNIAVSVGIALAMEVPRQALMTAIRTLPSAEHRANVYTTDVGVTVIDDTYNANPDGASRTLAHAAHLAESDNGRLWVVTPGMIELGHDQYERNRELGAKIGALHRSILTVTNQTNRHALVAGYRLHGDTWYAFRSRQEAVRFVGSQVIPGDVILYENDLPDHYP